MKESVFVDTDVIIDFLILREPFAQKSAEIFALVESEKIQVYVSSVCFGNIFYIIRKLVGSTKAIKLLQKLESISEVLPVNKFTIRQALVSKFSDFEDAIQNFSAHQESKIDTIITRNIKDFKLSDLTVQTPEEFISQYLERRQ